MRKELLSMGYREAQKDKWLKPVGYHLFIFDTQTKSWSNWFQAKELALWNEHFFEGTEDEFITFLKRSESDTKTNSFMPMGNHFLTRVQQIELL